MKLVIVILCIFIFGLLLFYYPRGYEILEEHDNVLLLAQVFFGEEERQIIDFSLLRDGIVGVQVWNSGILAREVNGEIQGFYGAKVLRIRPLRNKGDGIWVWELPEE